VVIGKVNLISGRAGCRIQNDEVYHGVRDLSSPKRGKRFEERSGTIGSGNLLKSIKSSGSERRESSLHSDLDGFELLGTLGVSGVAPVSKEREERTRRGYKERRKVVNVKRTGTKATSAMNSADADPAR
jgi:hypothetical protein